ncbi:MAG: 2-succinyl-6-hydroxy-2,4-cyclohexadiene-carboxylate synthase [Thermoleophilaceae bacterium]|jgi:2-succinyl-6-hydroxy-2,4-cyclohexadiene-1-carboxylate synthase|nr:2-succinyl-6-hydroxy-2,4-cyclohexadiene-carboxylate synthase [Thermoleophilaceae bacterium]
MVLFIPGFMQRGDAWRPVAELLPERYPSRLLDHAEHSFEGRMREIAEAGADVLVGYSLGGRLALRAALRSPESFTAVVLVGSTAGFEEGPLRVGRAEADEKLASWMEAMPIEDIVSLWERQPLFAEQADALVEQQRPGRLSHDPRSLALLLRTAGQGALEPVWHELRALELPLLAIAGARDDGYSAAAKRIAATAPQGRAVIVEDAGHAAHLQQPQRVADLITEFLERLH